MHKIYFDDLDDSYSEYFEFPEEYEYFSVEEEPDDDVEEQED